MKLHNILVIGGAGYVGSVLVPKLLKADHQVTVLDLYVFGEDVFSEVKNHPRFKELKGDMRKKEVLEGAFQGIDTLIHLACISNDASFDINPELGKSVNYDSTFEIIEAAKKAGVKRLIYASSAAVYGVKGPEENITETVPLNPQTDYAKYKALSEQVLLKKAAPFMTTTLVRSATVCGYSPRLRLDVVVNLFTNHAINKGEISVFNGEQVRPHIHIQDITDFYQCLVDAPHELIHEEIFNAGAQFSTISETGRTVYEIVTKNINKDVRINIVNSPDNRSCRLDSTKVFESLQFKPRLLVSDAVQELVYHFKEGHIPNPINDIRYYSLKTMKARGIQ